MSSPEEKTGEKVGVLLANLGTPDAPTYWAVRRFLRQFLADRRVVQLPRWLWLPILYLFVLTFRPFRSAEAYRKIWTEAGSPLLVYGRAQAKGVAQRLQDSPTSESTIEVQLGMSYGSPSIGDALTALSDAGCTRYLCLPLYPQDSGTTTGSVRDQIEAQVARQPDISSGAVEIIPSYPVDPGYIRALAASVREAWSEEKADILLLSFHGIPESYVRAGDDYPRECEATAAALRAELGLKEEEVRLVYQSRFGPSRWIGPSLVDTIDALAQEGVASVDVLCPGFSADCLETIEEVGMAGRERFEEGGGRLRLIPSLNDRSDHLDALAGLVLRAL